MAFGVSPEERELLHDLHCAVIAANADGIIVFASEEASDLLEREPPIDLIGKPLTTLMPPRLIPRHLEGFDRYRRTGRSRLLGKRIRASARTAMDDEKPIDLRIRLFRRPDGTDLIVAALNPAGEQPHDLDLSIDRFAETLRERAYTLI